MKFGKLYAQNVKIFQISTEVAGNKAFMDNRNRSQQKSRSHNRKDNAHLAPVAWLIKRSTLSGSTAQTILARKILRISASQLQKNIAAQKPHQSTRRVPVTRQWIRHQSRSTPTRQTSDITAAGLRSATLIESRVPFDTIRPLAQSTPKRKRCGEEGTSKRKQVAASIFDVNALPSSRKIAHLGLGSSLISSTQARNLLRDQILPEELLRLFAVSSVDVSQYLVRIHKWNVNWVLIRWLTMAIEKTENNSEENKFRLAIRIECDQLAERILVGIWSIAHWFPRIRDFSWLLPFVDGQTAIFSSSL